MRRSKGMRDLMQQTALSPKDFICPVFVQEGIKTRARIDSMPGIDRFPLDDLSDEVGTISDLGIPAVMLFGIRRRRTRRARRRLTRTE